MDLEKATTTLKNYKMNMADGDACCTAELSEALNIAIDTMEFFQKIKLFCVELLNNPEFIAKQNKIFTVSDNTL